MIFAHTPTGDEATLLEQYFKKGPNTLVRARAQAILMSAAGDTVPRIAGVVRYTAPVVREWVRTWNRERMASVIPRYTGNENAAKLTREQKQEIADTLAQPPSDYGLPGSFWLLPSLRHHVSTTFGVVYESDQSYYYLLKHCGYSWKLPSPFDIRRDDERVRARMEEIHAEIKLYMVDDTWVVLAQDETRVNWEEETRRAWLRRGEKTVVKLSRSKAGQSYAGFLNLATGTHHLVELDWQDTDNIVRALEAVSREYVGKRLCVIWDNAPWHRSRALRDELRGGGRLSHVHCVALPPYAPDENPEEHVWKYGKEELANQHFETFEHMKKRFTALLNNKRFNYKI